MSKSTKKDKWNIPLKTSLNKPNHKEYDELRKKIGYATDAENIRRMMLKIIQLHKDKIINGY
nr:hypothetical protein [uncultured Flavobacterium sp.]